MLIRGTTFLPQQSAALPPLTPEIRVLKDVAALRGRATLPHFTIQPPLSFQAVSLGNQSAYFLPIEVSVSLRTIIAQFSIPVKFLTEIYPHDCKTFLRLL